MKNMKLKKYPHWTCAPCGLKYATPESKKEAGTSTWHANKCGVCGKQGFVTELRDFGYPIIPGFENPRKISKFPEVEALMNIFKMK